MSQAVKEQAIEQGKKLLDRGLTTEEKYSPANQTKPKNDNDPKRSREIAKEKPATDVYDPPVQSSTPNAKDKTKGRSI